jgi:hypothetical protein
MHNQTILTEIKPSFDQYGWNMGNEEQSYLFTKRTKQFCINVNKSSIDITIPLKDSPELYRTSFDNYYDASEYILMHLDYQEHK